MTIERFDKQFRAAAFAALEILEGKGVDRVYCDYHDDFVVRRIESVGSRFHFFQVKTKGKTNHLWSLVDVFALKNTKKGPSDDEATLKAVADSFAGKLYVHSVNFGDACSTVTLLTNVQFHDDVEAAVGELCAGTRVSTSMKFLEGNFAKIFAGAADFEAAKIADTLKKLRLLPGVAHIGDDQAAFVDAARGAIYRFSEIDLEYREVEVIASNLVSLVYRKSFEKLPAGLTPEELDDTVGVGIDDLLGVLSISKDLYVALQKGEDEKALRNASMIQRRMRAAGATEEMIEFSTQQKVEWDVWYRSKRHNIPDFTLNFLVQRLHELYVDWAKRGGDMGNLEERIETLRKEEKFAAFESLTQERLLGGVLSAMVRSKAKA